MGDNPARWWTTHVTVGKPRGSPPAVRARAPRRHGARGPAPGAGSPAGAGRALPVPRARAEGRPRVPLPRSGLWPARMLCFRASRRRAVIAWRPGRDPAATEPRPGARTRARSCTYRRHLRKHTRVIRPQVWIRLWITVDLRLSRRGQRSPDGGRRCARRSPPHRRRGTAQCSAPPGIRASDAVEIAARTIRPSASAASPGATTSAAGTWTKPPRMPARPGSVARACCRR